jgi:hypothetical protein
MTRTPAEYKDLFSSINDKMTSRDPEDQKHCSTLEFRQTVESMVGDFQGEAPGMEGMMAFARENGFDYPAVIGMWMSVGIASATPGPRQEAWIKQREALTKNCGAEPGFTTPVFAMNDAAGAEFLDSIRKSLHLKTANQGVPVVDFPMAKVDMSDFAGFPQRKKLEGEFVIVDADNGVESRRNALKDDGPSR